MIDGVARDDCERCGHVFTAEEVNVFRAWCAKRGLPFQAVRICKPCGTELSLEKMQRVGVAQFWKGAFEDVNRAIDEKRREN